jgi:hypothetical protein
MNVLPRTHKSKLIVLLLLCVLISGNNVFNVPWYLCAIDGLALGWFIPDIIKRIDR